MGQPDQKTVTFIIWALLAASGCEMPTSMPPTPTQQTSSPAPLISTPVEAQTVATPIGKSETDNRNPLIPPGNRDDYVWVDGHTRGQTWVEGHWRKKTKTDRAKENKKPDSARQVATQPKDSGPQRIWVEGYTRKNGTKVKGYWREK